MITYPAFQRYFAGNASAIPIKPLRMIARGRRPAAGTKPQEYTMIDRETVSRVAELARIRVTEDEIPELTQRLGNILAMVDTLQAADTRDIAPLSNPLDATQRLRADAVTEPNQRSALLALAPASDMGTETRMIKGSRQLSYCAARTR